ncbi:hypothetical protein TRIATDRAFT_323077 [Trichoderma atroviride IMI 206040]|uniref:Uncharacterized protein n=1 Tax=Hypocrea atroviridis (strain ATCC 20476 / IMI 206040) TaxID=452589 RepID=G9PCF4_HYPAI|nr:uncharacterized protein TRIATDRAFT_323077 [Trichoderma atroviride IMI 206040]EHK39528.1 hypothetical protein TRIATDRAFT_323077 [Trichoderma atroviride IMI 206040]
MNWMGGNLARHRRGKGRKEDLANQKQYFAKARSWQREQAKTNPVVLSAANFIPNYFAASNAGSRVARSSSPPSLPVPLETSGNRESSANLANPSQNMQDNAAQQPLRVVPLSQTSRSAVFNNQSTKDHLVDTSGPEADRRRLLKEEDFMQSKLPKPSMVKPTQKRGHSTAARQVVGQQRQRQSANPTSHREIQPKVGGQRGNRKRKLTKITSPPVDTTIRIRVGSKSYQWSEAGHSIRDPTYNSSSPSPSADESRCIASTTGTTSYVIDESFTGLSSSTISPSPWLSPGSSRPAYRRKFSDPIRHLDRAGSAKSQCPTTAYTDALSLQARPPTMSAISSVSSMAVEVGNDQESPRIGIDEEDIWRAWLNRDMPELQVPKRQQDITADIGRPRPTPVPQGLAIATLRKRPPRT